jgi:hypothetical protein
VVFVAILLLVVLFRPRYVPVSESPALVADTPWSVDSAVVDSAAVDLLGDAPWAP